MDPRVTVVTISFNQAAYLERCLESVNKQHYKNIQYIVVDGGSTDGSIEIIERHRGHIDQVIIGKDSGPADALNRGFDCADGELYFFLNSDDELLPFAIRDLVDAINERPCIDILSGHSLLVDADGRLKRRLFSDEFSLTRAVRRAAYIMQPSTIFRADVYRTVRGFNSENRSSWDGELWIEMALAGARFGVVDVPLSLYRVHKTSITGSGAAIDSIILHERKMFRKVMGRDERFYDKLINFMFKIGRHVRNPRGFFERLFYGRIFGSGLTPLK